MTARSIVAVSVVALATAACVPQEGATGSDGTWVGTITAEGNVTTVVNESGSVWGGTARLVEEVSIGVETKFAPDPPRLPDASTTNSKYLLERRCGRHDREVPWRIR